MLALTVPTRTEVNFSLSELPRPSHRIGPVTSRGDVPINFVLFFLLFL